MGIVWGDGGCSPRGPLLSAGMSAWIGQLIRTVWQRVLHAPH